MNRILLVEDDERLANLVADYLQANSFQVTIESNGSHVEKRIKDLTPDLIVLDIMLPGKDGLSICQEVRPRFNGPILMLTARNDDVDQVLGLEYGADDYVIKPAEPRVLLARIKALLRRYHPEEQETPKTLVFGQLSVNLNARKASLSGGQVDLSSHEFDLLEVLVKQAGQILSREYLFNAIYARAYDGLDRTIDVRISQLRKKLGDNADKPERIKTIWGRGYLFVPDAWS